MALNLTLLLLVLRGRMSQMVPPLATFKALSMNEMMLTEIFVVVDFARLCIGCIRL